MARVLVVEDEPQLASFLEKGFSASGFAVETAEDGATAVALAREQEFDVVLLDLGLPDLDGLDVLSAVRRGDDRLPIIILSVRDDVDDKVAGLEGGADDYVSKPFRFEELLARVRARLRTEPSPQPTPLAVGRVALEVHLRRGWVDGRSVRLSARETTLLETLMLHHGQVLSREQLLSHVWGEDYEPDSNVVEVYVSYLRRKLGEDLIETVRGMGYTLRA